MKEDMGDHGNGKNNWENSRQSGKKMGRMRDVTRTGGREIGQGEEGEKKRLVIW